MLHPKQLLQLWLSHCGCFHIHLPVHTCALQTYPIPPHMFFFFNLLSQSDSAHVNFRNIHTLLEPRPDCCSWRYVVESSITRASLWTNQVRPGANGTRCSRAKRRPRWPVGARRLPGLFMTSKRGPHQSRGRWMDGWWLGWGCGFIRPTVTQFPLVTDSCVLKSSLLQNDNQLQGSLQTPPEEDISEGRGLVLEE